MFIQSRTVSSEIHNIRTSSVQSVKRTFKFYRAFKVIQGHPYWCWQKFRTLCRRNVQLMPTIFLRLTKILQRENCKYVDFNDPTPVWRRSCKKRLRISANDLYCQKLKL